MLRFLTAQAACMLMVSFGFAQQKDSVAAPKQVKLSNEWMVKFAPLPIFESDGGLSFSGEYLVAKQRIGYQLEVQPIFLSVSGDGGNSGLDKPEDVLQSGPLHGFKIRPEVRYYTDGFKLSQRPPRTGSSQKRIDPETRRRSQKRTYIAVDFLYKQVWQQRINKFYISNGGTQPGYR